ncbi:MAG: amidohydrolase, partial [Pedobacter sp.]
VYLGRIDGHAAIVNSKAIQLAGIKAGDQLTGGEIVVHSPEGNTGRMLTASPEFRGEPELTGLLIDNATNLVEAKIPSIDDELYKKLMQQAEKNCFAVGLTGITDCGLPFTDVDLISKWQSANEIQMRLNILLSDEKRNFDYLINKGKIKTDRLQVQGFKMYGDGALGSRGACLLHPYSDQLNHRGFLLSSYSHFDSVAALMYDKKFQLCTHAIGDSGNRTILNIYAKHLENKNDLRWRIEHAQVVNEKDFNSFGQYSIIPSIQPTHATSDMYWANERLGKDRIKGAYAYKQLLQQNGWLPLGTDFPVEDISPFKTFYAAVIRKDAAGWPANGFQTENALTRVEALRGMTIW